MFRITHLLICLFPVLTFAQSQMTPSWTKQEESIILSPYNDVEGWGLDVDTSGAIYWTISANHYNQGLDILSYKFDNQGNELWPTPFFYGGSGTQHAYVCNAKDTALYIGGKTCTGSQLTCDMSLLKVDKATGTLIWDASTGFSANGYDEVDGLEIRDDGIYCGGWAQELESPLWFNEIGLWKLDFDGNTEWSNYLGTTGTSEHQDGHFVVDDDYIYAAGLWGGSWTYNTWNGHSFLGRFSKADGSFVDSTLFGTQSSAFLDIENALGMTSDGTYLYITGYTTPVAGGDWQLFVAKYDKNLNQQWFIDWGAEGTETARAIAVKNGIIYIGGGTESASIMTGGGKDAIFLTLDTAGTILQYQTWGDANLEAIHDIAIRDDEVYLTGTAEDPSNGRKNAFLLALNHPTTNSLTEENSEILQFEIYPNPTLNSTTITLNKPSMQKSLLLVTNAAGQIIEQRQILPGEQEINLTLPEPGLYQAEVQFENYRISKRIIKQ